MKKIIPRQDKNTLFDVTFDGLHYEVSSTWDDKADQQLSRRWLLQKFKNLMV